MLHAQVLVELNRFGDQISIKLVQLAAEESGKVLGHIITLLEARAETIGQSSDVRHMLLILNLGLILDVLFELSITVSAEQPSENGFLNLLVVLVFEEVVREEFHGAHNEELSTLLALVEGTDGAVWREGNRSRTQDGNGRLAHIQGSTVGVHELETAILITLSKLILGVLVALGVLALLLLSGFGFTLGDADEFFVKATIANVGLLRVQVLEKGFADD